MFFYYSACERDVCVICSRFCNVHATQADVVLNAAAVFVANSVHIGEQARLLLDGMSNCCSCCSIIHVSWMALNCLQNRFFVVNLQLLFCFSGHVFVYGIVHHDHLGHIPVHLWLFVPLFLFIVWLRLVLRLHSVRSELFPCFNCLRLRRDV